MDNQELMHFDAEKTAQDCVAWIKGWFDKNGKDCNAIIGISGGKDSSVVAALCVAALGKDRVIGIKMPQGVQKDIDYSDKLIQHLGIRSYTANIGDAVDAVLNRIAMTNTLPSEQTKSNLPARLRMATLYAFSQTFNGRVSCNSNASERYVGWGTRWGDTVGDFAPIINLTTWQIRQIGTVLGLPADLVNKTPIDGLTFNEDGSYRTDEDNLGVMYDDIDCYIQCGDADELFIDDYRNIRGRRERSLFKTRPIPSFPYPNPLSSFSHPFNSEKCFDRLLADLKEHKKLIIAFDFDNTLYDYAGKGANNEQFRYIKILLQRANRLNHTLVLFTTATDDAEMSQKVNWCMQNGIVVDYVNDSPVAKGAKKPYYNILLDDHAGLEEAATILNDVLDYQEAHLMDDVLMNPEDAYTEAVYTLQK